MVQYKSATSRPRADYWKPVWFIRQSRGFMHDGLNALNFQVNASTGGTRLAYLTSRAQRGLTSFEKCSLAELKEFCIARKIQQVNLSSRKKRDFIDTLENDDDDGARFHQFLELPSELRNRIYCLYMQSLGAWSHSSISRYRSKDEIAAGRYLPPPPITQVCSTIRQETMSMFFDIYRPRFAGSTTLSSCIAATDEFGLKIIPPHLVCYAKKIAIHGNVRKPGASTSFFGRPVYEVHINFATDHKPMRIIGPFVPELWHFIADQPASIATMNVAQKEYSRFLAEQQDSGQPATMLTKEVLETLSEVCARVVEEVHDQLKQ